MYPPSATGPGRSRDGGTNGLLVVIALAIELIVVLISLASLGPSTAEFTAVFPGAGAVYVAAEVGIAIFDLILVAAVYLYCYQPIRAGAPGRARTPTLVLGLILIPFGAIIVGLLLLFVWYRIGEQPPGPGAPVWTGAPPPMPYGSPTPGPPLPSGPPAAPTPPPPPGAAAYCSRCGRPATFIPQYQRSYCYSCQQYV